jgi:methylphosphotriester-DNA--protein-cysteine methyltransferase
VSPEIISDLFLSSSYAQSPMRNRNIAYEKAAKKSNSISFPKGEYFVANKNSDIFHYYNCKAVDRINENNIVVFQSMSDAKKQNFKPCRMCCNVMTGNNQLMHKFKQKVAVSH